MKKTKTKTKTKANSKSKAIVILDWASNVLFEGAYDDKEASRIMRINKAPNDDIFVYWADQNDDRNVYEYISFSRK